MGGRKAEQRWLRTQQRRPGEREREGDRGERAARGTRGEVKESEREMSERDF